MALDEKKKKAIAAAVAYYIEQEEAAAVLNLKARNMWVAVGKETIMHNREVVQRRGRIIHSR